MGKSVKYPTPPDPVATANAQGEMNRDTAITQAELNMVDQQGPFGSLTYTRLPGQQTRQFDQAAYDKALEQWSTAGGTWQDVNIPGDEGGTTERRFVPGPGGGPQPQRSDFYYMEDDGTPRYQATTTLSPEQQGIYQGQMGLQQNLLDVGNDQLGRVSSALAQPLNFQGIPQAATGLPGSVARLPQQYKIGASGAIDQGAPQYSQNRQNIGNVGGLVRDVDAGQIGRMGPVDTNRSGIGNAGALTRGVAPAGLARTAAANQNRQNIGQTGPIQRGVGADDFGDDRQRVEDALMQRMQPYLDQRREQERTRLVNQGFADPGSQGYSTAMDEVYRAENDARLAAILNAGDEQSRLFGMDVAAGQFANTAQQQAFGQAGARATLANQNIDANLQNRMAVDAFNNQVGLQGFDQRMANAGLNNAAQQQAFGQMGARAAMDNANIDANLANQMATRGFNNQAQAQEFGQGVTAGQFANTAQQQAYDQAAGRVDRSNANIDANLRNDIAAQQTQNLAQQQMFDQQATRAGFYNQAQAQNFGQNVAQNQAAFDQAAYQNALRDRAIQERMLLRQTPINEISALTSGAQVQLPQFANTPQTSIQAPDLQGATYASYQGQLANAQAQAQQNNAFTQGLFSLGGSALGGFGGGGGFQWLFG